MEKLVLLMLMFATCYAAPKDLSGKVFVFPKETNSDRVQLLTSKTEFSSVTVCLKYLTDITRNFGLFSMSTPGHDNDFLLFKKEDKMSIHARDGSTEFLSLSLPPNTWHTVCSTWNSDNGLGQLWLNGKPGIKRFVHSGQAITGSPIAILGQEQDTYGGGFDATQSFLGMISELHMWDYVLSAAEIKRYVNDENFTVGNVFNWRALEYELHGKVMVDDAPEMW
ncbi:serum amyloid P-component-like [Stegastes partitus]|uniref:Pentraxin family member n=1 Tax=Stegastes partitus TaxID=144197 RepID=A0A3B4Z5B2_9TELE|nr:PREDICTED: serum amyloid P-component-like [Stegastes partitus]